MTADTPLPASQPRRHIADERIQLVDARNRPCGSVFVVKHDGPLVLQAEEVVEAFWLALDQAGALAVAP